jgi:hypothetical protein
MNYKIDNLKQLVVKKPLELDCGQIIKDFPCAKFIIMVRDPRDMYASFKLIKEFDCKYYIENPRGYLRKMYFMQGIPRATIWYCRYNAINAKPTDIFSNNIYNPLFNIDGWKPRPICFNGNINCHHEAAPRGSKTGTQGLKGNYERSKIPKELCDEIIETLK